jgi:hypothetical protein
VFAHTYKSQQHILSTFLRSPHGRVKIRKLDASKAITLDGAVDIVTWEDPEVLSINPGLTNPPVWTMAGIHGPLIKYLKPWGSVKT